MNLQNNQKSYEEIIFLYENGKFTEALTQVKHLIKNYPNEPFLHNISGVINLSLENFEESLLNFLKVKELTPNNADVYNNLGVVFRNLNKTKEALTNFNKAVLLSPEKKIFWQNLSTTLKGKYFNLYNDKVANIFLSILEQKTVVRPKNLVKPILSLLKKNSFISEAIEISKKKEIKKSFEKISIGLSKMPLFLKLIEVSTIPDLEIEKLLVNLRKFFLFNIEKIINKESILNFQISLALHCFTNDFIFHETEKEELLIKKIEQDIKNSLLNEEKINLNKIACLASYRSLYEYKFFHKIKNLNELHRLFLIQVEDVLKDDFEKSKIDSIINNKDKTSNAVREQYEKNPYPRWINTEINYSPISINFLIKRLNLKFNKNCIFSKNPKILVAGCGTGEHSIGAATRYLNSEVLAIDLSLKSLSYAIRKTKEFGINNIKYMQADVLELKNLEKDFDIIESSGVIHHMKDPIYGLKVLTDCLKKNGLMRIAVYSDIARKSISEAKKIILEKKISTTKKSMLKFRQEIIDKKYPNLLKIKNHNDFYSTSELRDLLFHVQEHRFTLTEIKQILKKLNLEFLGFEIDDKNIRNRFKEKYSKPEAAYSLDAWNEFETLNPDIFSNMYQFWLMKI
tara:strand:- start:492 stop:2369 length:1878 start_codon:yes stop_codon:yes gene_type:complete